MSLLVPPRRPSHEILDETDLAPDEMARSLEDLELVNTALGSARLLEERMADHIRLDGGSRATMLDVGAGSASVARELEGRLERQGLTARVTATDRQWRHLAVGRSRGGREFPAVAADAFSLPFPERSMDWVVSTLLVHHFLPQGDVRMPRWRGRGRFPRRCGGCFLAPLSRALDGLGRLHASRAPFFARGERPHAPGAGARGATRRPSSRPAAPPASASLHLARRADGLQEPGFRRGRRRLGQTGLHA